LRRNRDERDAEERDAEERSIFFRLAQQRERVERLKCCGARAFSFLHMHAKKDERDMGKLDIS